MLVSLSSSFQVPLTSFLASSSARKVSSDMNSSGRYWPIAGAETPFVPAPVGSKMSRVALSSKVVPIAYSAMLLSV